MKKLFLLILLLAVYTTLLSQAVGINTDGSVPHPSSILDIKSSTKGLLIPRTSTSTRLSILNGANGLMLYDTTIGSFWFQNSGLWIESGRIDILNNNTFFGFQSGKAIPIGDFNTGFGAEALFSNTNGIGNTALGNGSIHSNTTGNYNTANGMFALYFNTTGFHNTAIGTSALILNQTGYSNVAVGSGALFHNTSGNNAVAIGDSALFNSEISDNNTAVGSKALFASNSGNRNTAVGTQSLRNNTTGYQNTAVGAHALASNSIGYNNVGIGYVALATNTGNENIGIGAGSLQFNEGNVNVAIGNVSLQSNVGDSNVAVGYNTEITGSKSTVLGTNAFAANNVQNSTAIGYNSIVSCSNCLALGGNNTTSRTRVGINAAGPVTDLHIRQQSDANFDDSRGIRLQRPAGGNQWRVFLDPLNNYIFQYNNNLFSYIEPVSANYVSSSDERLKKNISVLPSLLDKVMLLQPKTYQYIASADASRYSYGFIAQEVEKLFPEFVFTAESDIKGIAYHNFSVIAIKAIQEQQLIIEEQKQKLDMQQQQIEEILKELSYLRKKIEQ